jgi:hypothetical protein
VTIDLAHKTHGQDFLHLTVATALAGNRGAKLELPSWFGRISHDNRRFIEIARDVGADEDGATLKAKLAVIVR